MESLSDFINVYRKQLEKGAIQKAYKGLMEYIMDLRTLTCPHTISGLMELTRQEQIHPFC